MAEIFLQNRLDAVRNVRTCAECGEVKSLQEFYKAHGATYRGVCKICVNNKRKWNRVVKNTPRKKQHVHFWVIPIRYAGADKMWFTAPYTIDNIYCEVCKVAAREVYTLD